MYNEAHANNLEEAFNDENVSENDTPPFNGSILLNDIQVLGVNSETVVSISHEQ